MSQTIDIDVRGAVSGEDYVRWAYRLLLNREPENQDVVRDHPFKDDRNKLIASFLNSMEFKIRYHDLSAIPHESPYSLWNREAVAFIHLHKTGGTTLHALLETCFPRDRVCPERFEALHVWSPLELAHYDLFSGHFDCFALRYIPRERVRTVTILRDPYERQISHYRFCRAHSPREFASDHNARLANELGPEEFFEHEATISQVWFNNTYLLVFGASLFDLATLEALVAEAMQTPKEDRLARQAARPNERIAHALTRAKERIVGLDAIGLTEKFSESVETIFRALKLPVPEAIDARMVTDDLPDHDAKFVRAPPVRMTPRLARALDRLTKYDRILYDFAKSEFSRRKRATAAAL